MNLNSFYNISIYGPSQLLIFNLISSIPYLINTSIKLN